MFKGNSIWETLENYCVLFIVVGAILLSSGLGLSALFEKGISAILALFGGFMVISATTVMIFSWVIKEFR